MNLTVLRGLDATSEIRRHQDKFSVKPPIRTFKHNVYQDICNGILCMTNPAKKLNIMFELLQHLIPDPRGAIRGRISDGSRAPFTGVKAVPKAKKIVRHKSEFKLSARIKVERNIFVNPIIDNIKTFFEYVIPQTFPSRTRLVIHKSLKSECWAARPLNKLLNILIFVACA